MSLSKWVKIIKDIFECPKTRNQIISEIKENCLRSQNLIFGSYDVDNQAVWDKILIKDKKCAENLKKFKIDNLIELEAWYVARLYHIMWDECRTCYKKFK